MSIIMLLLLFLIFIIPMLAKLLDYLKYIIHSAKFQSVSYYFSDLSKKWNIIALIAVVMFN